MAKLLDDLMTRVGADWEPVESRGKYYYYFCSIALGACCNG